MLTRSDIDRVVSAALAEDAPWGDATAEAFVVTADEFGVLGRHGFVIDRDKFALGLPQ